MLHESGTVRIPGDHCFHVHVCDVDGKSLPSFVLTRSLQLSISVREN